MDTLKRRPRSKGRILWPWVALLLLTLQLVLVRWARAEVVEGSATGIVGDADRLISYRHQEHAWQTPDGAHHVLVNRGSLSPGASLTLYSSFDEGSSWQQGPELSYTNALSTSDGVLVGDELWVVFSSFASTILFGVFDYDSSHGRWALTKLERVYKDEQLSAENPALVIDREGAVWCAFSTKDAALHSEIRLFRRASAASAWQDTQLVFGADDPRPDGRSARPVLVPGGIGLAYTVHETLFWAERRDAWSVERPWETTLLYQRSSEQPDPYGSHFSVVPDSQGSLHLVLPDQGRLRYMNRSADAGLWSERWISNDIGAVYIQVSIERESDVLLVFANTAHGNIRVVQSADRGQSFFHTGGLVHRGMGDDVSFRTPRVEAPSSFWGDVSVLQQYQEADFQSLLHFRVAPLAEAR